MYLYIETIDMDMQTITVQINDEIALKTIHALESNHSISIVDNSIFTSPALPGSPLSVAAFKKWINDAEKSPTYSLNEVKAQWAARKKQLQNNIK